MSSSEESEAYRIHTEGSVRDMIAGQPGLAVRLGGIPAGWDIREIGDGNLNLVFRLAGPQGGLIVKQALPYLRLAGPSWPLSKARSFYESLALRQFGRLQPGALPALLYADAADAVIVMELLHPHVTLRNALLHGRRLAALSDHLSSYLANTLFHTSDAFLPPEKKAALMARYAGNHEMLAVTDMLVFTEPFRSSARNRWTSPELDSLVAELKADAVLLRRVEALRQRFLNNSQALLHGDLHTSSIMVTETETRIIDPEFVFYGPIGFDLGMLVGDLLLNCLAQAGHRHDVDYSCWTLRLVETIWLEFGCRFEQLRLQHQGSLSGHEAAGPCLQVILRDTVGYAAIEMMRRVLGLAHVADFELIEDRAARAACERATLLLSRRIIMSDAIDSIHALTAQVRSLVHSGSRMPSPSRRSAYGLL